MDFQDMSKRYSHLYFGDAYRIERAKEIREANAKREEAIKSLDEQCKDCPDKLKPSICPIANNLLDTKCKKGD